jgi:hypothetical protein
MHCSNASAEEWDECMVGHGAASGIEEWKLSECETRNAKD